MIWWKLGVVIYLFLSICAPIWIYKVYRKKQNAIRDNKIEALQSFCEETKLWSWQEIEQYAKENLPEKNVRVFLKEIRTIRHHV